VNVAERMIEADGVELCTEAFGDSTDPPNLLGSFALEDAEQRSRA
jgi:hypothetical protein